MRPSTDYELVTAVLHELRDVDHDWHPSCCGAEPHDRLEARDLVDAIRERGAHISFDLVLPKSAPKGDPATAAESIDDLSDRQWAVWWVIGLHGDLTDEETVEHYESLRRDFNLAPQTAQSVRSRRAELVRAGHVEKLKNADGTDAKRQTDSGGWAQVWVSRGENRGQAAA